MKILFVENAILPTRGGVERVTYTLYKGFQTFGHQCFVYFRQADSDDIEASYKYQENETQSITEQLSTCIVKWGINLLICQNLHGPKYWDAYKFVKAKYKVNIVTVLHSNPEIWVNKSKWGHTTHFIYFKELLRSLAFRLLGNPYRKNQIQMYNLSDRYVLLSDSFKPVFCRLNRVDGKKLTAISNPCSFSEQYSEKQDKNNTVLVVTRMAEQQKRITEVLKIWKEANIPNWSLVLIGDGPDLSLYKRMAASMHLKNIEFLGAQKHPEKWYRSSKIFLMTSVWEGLSMTLLEAQHYGCVPIVYNSFSAVYDIIEDNKTGKIIQHNDFNGFVEALRHLTRDGVTLQSMSTNAMISSNSKYDLQTILQQWEALFSSLDLKTSR